ncbi:hypothetical protein ACE193_21470 [Bernardetia sp. OM2101]|uniref:hypothetical protein n=1 Tax=Bernardetia sp. OM2101 TaxID=3344876 RepID=UPI0035CF7808
MKDSDISTYSTYYELSSDSLFIKEKQKEYLFTINYHIKPEEYESIEIFDSTKYIPIFINHIKNNKHFYSQVKNNLQITLNKNNSFLDIRKYNIVSSKIYFELKEDSIIIKSLGVRNAIERPTIKEYDLSISGTFCYDTIKGNSILSENGCIRSIPFNIHVVDNKR